MVPGLLGHDLFGFATSQSNQAPEVYCTQVLQRIGDGVLQDYAPGSALLVNYNELPAALWTDVLPHFAISCSADDIAVMAQAARYDAKSPELCFKGDTAAKHNAATDPIRPAAERLGGLHAKLETMRRPGRTAIEVERRLSPLTPPSPRERGSMPSPIIAANPALLRTQLGDRGLDR
jgi:hypothetical protein